MTPDWRTTELLNAWDCLIKHGQKIPKLFTSMQSLSSGSLGLMCSDSVYFPISFGVVQSCAVDHWLSVLVLGWPPVLGELPRILGFMTEHREHFVLLSFSFSHPFIFVFLCPSFSFSLTFLVFFSQIAVSYLKERKKQGEREKKREIAVGLDVRKSMVSQPGNYTDCRTTVTHTRTHLG